MNETKEAVTYGVVIGVLLVLAGLVYTYSAVAVDARRADSAIDQYFECLRKMGTFDWSKVDGGKPGSSGEVCRELARQRQG